MTTSANANKSVIVCEPQCCGFEHSSFNAAFLASVLYAHPECDMIFMGEKEHFNFVRMVLEDNLPELASRVKWMHIPLPSKIYKSIWRLGHELRLLKQIQVICNQCDAEVIYFCSFIEVGLLALLLKVPFWRESPPIFTVAHWILGTLLFRRSKKPWKWKLNFQFLLHFPHPRKMKYIVLGDSLMENLRKIRPRFAARFVPIDLPYLWDRKISATLTSIPEKIRFGFLGCRPQGIIEYYAMVDDIEKETTKADFTLVGFLHDPELKPESIRRRGLPIKPLSTQEYASRARELTYTVWCGRADDYRLIASAAFLDSLAYLKPGFYIRTPYIEHYFKIMGDIGYLCENIEEMHQAILSVITDFPLERYQKQCENIIRGRHLFAPDEVADKLVLYARDLNFSTHSVKDSAR